MPSMTLDRSPAGAEFVMRLRAAAGHQVTVTDTTLGGALGPFVRASLRRMYRMERRSGLSRPEARIRAMGDLVYWAPVRVERVERV